MAFERIVQVRMGSRRILQHSPPFAVRFRFCLPGCQLSAWGGPSCRHLFHRQRAPRDRLAHSRQQLTIQNRVLNLLLIQQTNQL